MATKLIQNHVLPLVEHTKQHSGPVAHQHFRGLPEHGRAACAKTQQHNASLVHQQLRGLPEQGGQISGQMPLECAHPVVQVQNSTPMCDADVLLQGNFVTETECRMLSFIDRIYAGEDYSVAEAVGQMKLEQNVELMFMARFIVTKALGEPQHSEVCAILSRALHLYLPALPPPNPGKKAESFMHALLDAFQVEFEDLLSNPFEPLDSQQMRPTYDGQQALQVVPSNKTRATVQFAGHLHRQSLLGTRVVSQMVQDLVGCGAVGCARELLRMIGVSLDSSERGNLGTVLEVPSDTDGEASSQAEQISEF